MEAKVEKKSLEGAFKTYKMRLWRVKDKRLIHYNSSCTEWDKCTTKNVKLVIDLQAMTFASFYPKSDPKPNILLIKSPKIEDMLLRFDHHEKKEGRDTMGCWLKVLTAWGTDRKNNRIYVAIPSNYSYALWTVLCALYAHPQLLTTEGVFRQESTNVRVKHELCSELLYEQLSVLDLQQSKYNDIHLLAKTLQYLLLNLPSSLFGDENFNDLIQEVNELNIENTIDDKKQSQVSESQLDSDVAAMTQQQLKRFKTFLSRMYQGTKHQHRYGLIALILQLLKQITMQHTQNRMTCHAMARLFGMCFESKIYLQDMIDPFRSFLLTKVLIYHSYYLFPRKQWSMKQIVVAEKSEASVMEKYRELQLSKKQKNRRLKDTVIAPPTKHFDENMLLKSEQFSVPESAFSDDENDDYKASPILCSAEKLNRYKSHDDLDIGGLVKRELNVTITGSSAIADRTNHRFEAVHTKRHKSQQSTSSLSNHHSYTVGDQKVDDEQHHKLRPHNKRQRSMSVPHIVLPQTEQPKMIKTNSSWSIIHQTKIREFNEPCYFNDGNDEYIYFICNSAQNADRQCWKYNIRHNEYKPFVRYPEQLRLTNFTASCDPHGQRLFILGGNTEFAELMNLNYCERQETEYVWNEKNAHIYCDAKHNKEKHEKHKLFPFGDDAASVFIGGDIRELHVIGGKLTNQHIRWDEHARKMVKLHSFQFTGIQGHQLLYIHNEWSAGFKSKLLLLGGYAKYPASRSKGFGYSDAILCCDVVDRAQSSYAWSPCNASLSPLCKQQNTVIKLPVKAAYFGAVVYKNLFLIVFGGTSTNNKKLDSVWYLSIISMKWTKSSIKCPMKSRGYYAVMTDNEVIHLFQRDSIKHFCIKAKDIVPDKELNLAKHQQETYYKSMKLKLQTKSTLEIEREKQQTEAVPASTTITPDAPSTSEAVKKREKNEHVPIFSDDEDMDEKEAADDDDDDDNEEPPVNLDALESVPRKKSKSKSRSPHVDTTNRPKHEVGSSTGYHIRDVSNDPFYNQHSGMKMNSKSPKNKRASASKRKRHSSSSSSSASSSSKRHSKSHHKKHQKQHQYPENPVSDNDRGRDKVLQNQYRHNNHNGQYYTNNYRDAYRAMSQRRDAHSAMNTHQITRQQIDDDRFSCKVMYNWFAALCGYQHGQIYRVASDSQQVHDEKAEYNMQPAVETNNQFQYEAYHDPQN